MTQVRPTILAGAWYPSDPGKLRGSVEAFLAAADPSKLPRGKPRIAVVPHAGYAYSGPTAGKLYGHLRGFDYDAVFILAPSHRSRLARATLSGMDAFSTPLGHVPVAVDIVQELISTRRFSIDDRAHAFEHAVEIQLPFLQCALPQTPPIVPILIPHLQTEALHATAAVLDRWRDDRHLFLVSSDLTHYGGSYGYVPFTEDIPRRLEQLDTGAILKILAHDADGLLRYGASSGITMCGLEAAAVALAGRAPEGYEAALLDYARSADREQDFSMSVSYASVVICDGLEARAAAPEAAASAHGCAESDSDSAAFRRASRTAGATDAMAAGAGQTEANVFTTVERAFLLSLARTAVAAAAAGRRAPDPEAMACDIGLTIPSKMRERRGAFVTLTESGRLRGCIGTIEPVKSLLAAVVDGARSAAVDDPRFNAVRENEVPRLHLEISILTPLRNVDGPEDIEIGRHGVFLTKGRHRAVFLPQVAVEQGWDRETTLDHLAVKAGLPADAWRSGTEFQVFEAELLAEESS